MSLPSNLRLENAITSNNIKEVMRLIKVEKVDPTKECSYFTPLSIASGYGFLDIVKYLIEKCGIDPSSENNLPINWAATSYHFDVVQYLMEKGADIYENLMLASKDIKITIAEYLTEYDIPFNEEAEKEKHLKKIREKYLDRITLRSSRNVYILGDKENSEEKSYRLLKKFLKKKSPEFYNIFD